MRMRPVKVVSNENVRPIQMHRSFVEIKIFFFLFSDEYDGEDSSNSKSFRNYQNYDKKTGINKDSTTDNDIMVNKIHFPLTKFK